MIRYLLISVCLLFCGCLTLNAQQFTTHEYAPGLSLDLFQPELKDGESAPVVLFVHGGGFSGGDRTSGHTLGQHLATRGIATASISYTLFMKGRTQDWGCDGILTAKVRTIQEAVNDTWAATAWLVQHAGEFQLDPQMVFLAGSSAGGETILHAAFWDRAELSLRDHGLAPDFRYAGISSGAGAIMDLNLVSADKLIPLQLFHGAKDPVVPYATAAHHFCKVGSSGWLMLFGSASLANHAEALGGSVHLITHSEAGHEIAGRYFHTYPGRVATFVDWVVDGMRFTLREVRE